MIHRWHFVFVVSGTVNYSVCFGKNHRFSVIAGDEKCVVNFFSVRRDQRKQVGYYTRPINDVYCCDFLFYSTFSGRQSPLVCFSSRDEIGSRKQLVELRGDKRDKMFCDFTFNRVLRVKIRCENSIEFWSSLGTRHDDSFYHQSFINAHHRSAWKCTRKQRGFATPQLLVLYSS